MLKIKLFYVWNGQSELDDYKKLSCSLLEYWMSIVSCFALRYYKTKYLCDNEVYLTQMLGGDE